MFVLMWTTKEILVGGLEGGSEGATILQLTNIATYLLAHLVAMRPSICNCSAFHWTIILSSHS